MWVGSDYTLDRIDDMQIGAIELLQEERLTLPPKSFVFYMHQGYQFFLLTPDAVLYYMEGKHHFENKFKTFEEFFDATSKEL